MSEPARKDIGALWWRVSRNGRKFLTGTVNGHDIVVFENERKAGKQPDFRIFPSQQRDGQSEGTRRLDTRERDRPSRVDDTEIDW